MNRNLGSSTPEQLRFKTISDFKWCVQDGGEVGFTWNNKHYHITHPENRIIIYEDSKPETEKWCDTPDEALEYIVGGDRLRDVITKVTVTDRTL